MSSNKYYWPGWAADPEEGFGAVLRYTSSGGLEFHDGTASGTFHPLKESLLGTVSSGSGGEYRFLNQTGNWQSLSAGSGLQFSGGTFSLSLTGGTACQRNQQVEVGSSKTLSDCYGLPSRMMQAESTLAVLTDDEYTGSSAVIFQGGEIELRWDASHQSANRQILIRHPLIFSGCRKVKLEGLQVCPGDNSSGAIIMSEGGLIRMNHVTCEHCSQAVFADTGAFVYLENGNCFGSGTDKGLYLETGASALTKEGEMLNLAGTPATPDYGSEGYALTKNAAVSNSSALTDNGIILRMPDNSTLISANFGMSGITVSSGSRISAGPNADGRDMQIASGGNIRLHIGPKTSFAGSSGGNAFSISSGVWSGFSGNISSLIIGSGAEVHHFSGSAAVTVEESGIFSSSVLAGGTLTICSGGTVANVTLQNGATSSRL